MIVYMVAFDSFSKIRYASAFDVLGVFDSHEKAENAIIEAKLSGYNPRIIKFEINKIIDDARNSEYAFSDEYNGIYGLTLNQYME